MEYIEKNKIEIAKNIIKEVDEKVRRVYWTNEEIDDKFVKRSTNKILEEGNTCFMNPCGDITLVTSYLLFQKKIPHNLVIEEHLPTKEFNFNRLHFVIEFKDENKTHVLNYKRLNEVYLGFGKYNGRKDLPSKQIIRISSEDINFKKSLYENLNESHLIKKLERYSLEKNLNRLKRDNSIENYNNFKKKYGKNFIIKLL